MSIVCEEIFDEQSHPSIEEIKDYAIKIGIDPDDEPQFLPIAAEGLMKALPPAWKPCYDDKTKSYYYYNRTTGKTQWEHPLDNVYRNMVKKARIDSQSISLGEPTDDATYARDELPSLEEPPLLGVPLLPKKLEPFLASNKAGSKTLSPRRLTRSPTIDINGSPRHELKFVKQKSEDHIFINKKLSLNPSISSSDDLFEKHPKILDAKTELKVSGGGSMFLKSNTKKQETASENSQNSVSDKMVENKLRIESFLNNETPLDIGKIQQGETACFKKNDTKEIHGGEIKIDSEDKKNVRFNMQDRGMISSGRSLSEDEEDTSKQKAINPVVQVSLGASSNAKSPFTLTIQDDVHEKPPMIPKKCTKITKPTNKDFIKPKLIRTGTSDSEDEVSNSRVKRITMEEIDLDSESSQESPNEKLPKKTMQLEQKLEKQLEKLKKRMWRSKNEELAEFQDSLEDSQREELKRVIAQENENQKQRITEEIERLKTETERKQKELLEEERSKLEDKLKLLKLELITKFNEEEEEMKRKYEFKKEELERYYEEKLVEIETDLAESMEKNRDEIIVSHNALLEELKRNNTEIMDQITKEFQVKEKLAREGHNQKLEKLKESLAKELISDKTDSKYEADEKYEKLKNEKLLLEDKYRCLKEKYIRLKADIKSTIEKKIRKKEEVKSGGTITTGSETERSFSINKDRSKVPSLNQKSADKPPALLPSKPKTEEIGPKEVSPNDFDTSISDRSEDKNKNDYDTSDNSISHRRNRRKIFSRVKSHSATRNKGPKNAIPERTCSPVENLRRQLQKLEDLEDQFPQNQQSDTYHLRYPFSDGHQFEGSSELEFFRHKIHLERDSIKRAKENLRSQKALFQQRQKELKLKHGTMARHTYQQLCQEEKDLTDMEVSLHRTRSLLGEKVIRIRHLEQTLQRATTTNESKYDDATLSDLSSHSASSGISSTEFVDAQFAKSYFKDETSLQEPAEIIQSLENLNSEIKEIWEVLRKQHQHSGNTATVISPFVYPDLGWPVLASTAAVPAPPSIPTLADRLNNYRQHIALAKAQSTMVTHASQGTTTTLVERTRNLRHWLKQAGIENAGETSNNQADL